MALHPYAHCTYCGSAFPLHAPWPRTCLACGSTSFRNPLPVCVVLVPVTEDGRKGVLAVRRAIPPQVGELALPGGYINYGETWQEAGAREVYEETGVRIASAEIQEFRVRSAPDGTLIIFGRSAPLRLMDLPAFEPNDEASQRLVLQEPTPMAFGLHTEVLELFFSAG